MQTLQSTDEKPKFRPTAYTDINNVNQQEIWQDFANLAAQVCGMPMAMIFLKEDEQPCLRWQVGLSSTAAEREISFCSQVIEQKKALVIPDVLADQGSNHQQRADLQILSYVGIPLVTSEGNVVGAISVMDYLPQQLSPQQLAALQALGRQLSKQLELRQDLVELAQALQESEEREDKLRNSEQELLDFIENGTVAMHWVDANGIIIWANQAELSLLGYSQEEYIGHPIAEFHADEAAIADILERLTANETLKNYEARLKSKDGLIKYVLINSNVSWEDNEFKHTRCFSNDITERKQAEIALEQATQENLKLVRVLDAVSDGVIITDALRADNPIIYLNPAFSKITGYSPEEAKGRNCRLLQGKDTDQDTLAKIRDSLKQRQKVETTLLNYRKDGRPFWNELKIFPVFAEGGNLLYFVGVTTDITERKLAEEERDRFFNLSRDLLCIAALDGYFKRLNPAFSEILGYSNEEMLNQPFLSFIHPEDQASTIKEVEKLSVGKPTIYFENRYRTLDGSYRWLAWTATPVVEESLIYATGRDITNSKQVQQERLEILEREKVARAEAEAARLRVTNILESITDGFFALDKRWRFTYINSLAEPLLQRKREELLGKCVWGEFPEAVGSLFYQGYHRAVSKQVKVAFEAFYPPLKRWFSVHAYPSEEGLYVYFDDITQRKQAEDALRHSEERFQLIAQATNDTVWDWDLLTQSVWWNEGIRTVFGYSAEIVGADVNWWYENLHPEDCDRVASQIQAVIDSNESSWSEEYRYRCADGSYAYVFDRGKVLRDESGKPVRMIGGMMDITKRKQAETQLRIAQEQLSHLLTSSPAVIYSCQPRGNYNTTFISENVSLMLGYDSQEIMADKDFWLKHFHLEDVKRILPELNRIFEQGSQVLEYRFRHKDETYRWLRDELKLVRDERGEPIEIVGCCVDVTERKLAEEELQRRHRCSQLFAEITLKIRQSLNIEEILTTTVTEVQKILQVDRVLLYRVWPNGTGRAVTEAVNSGWPAILDRSFPEEVFPQEYQEVYRQGKVQAIADVEQAYAQTTPCLLKFLKPWCVKAKLVVPILLSGQLWGLLIAHHCSAPRPWSRFETDLLQQLADQIAVALSQAQLLEQETRQRKELAISNAELQEFAYVASHDLQEPLRKIQAFSDRLQSKFADSLTDQGRDYLERMQNAAGRMQGLIEDLLTLSRITTKARPFVECLLNHVVQDVLSDLEIRIQQTSGQIEVEALPTIEADPIQMRQLLQNLIANALKFHRDEEPPVIRIYSRLLQEQAGQVIEGENNAELCQICVEDNGIGFEEKYLDRIFKAFQRLHGRSQYEGTGMGLAICRKIAERHDGSITAESRPGVGATFIVTLPLKQSQ